MASFSILVGILAAPQRSSRKGIRAASSSRARRRGLSAQNTIATKIARIQTRHQGRRSTAKWNQLIAASLLQVRRVDVAELHHGAEHLEVGDERVHLGGLGPALADRRRARVAGE